MLQVVQNEESPPAKRKDWLATTWVYATPCPNRNRCGSLPTGNGSTSRSTACRWVSKRRARGSSCRSIRRRTNPLVNLHYRTNTNTVLTDHETCNLRPDGYDPIFDEGEKLFGETCTMVQALDGGLRVYMLFQPDEPVDFGGGAMVHTVGMAASLDSSIATSMHAFAFDPGCTNAFTSRTEVVRVKATANHDKSFTERMGVIAQTVNHTKAMAKIARIANDQEFTELEFTRMVSELPKVVALREAAATQFDVAKGMHVPAHKTRVELRVPHRLHLGRVAQGPCPLR